MVYTNQVRIGIIPKRKRDKLRVKKLCEVEINGIQSDMPVTYPICPTCGYKHRFSDSAFETIKMKEDLGDAIDKRYGTTRKYGVL